MSNVLAIGLSLLAQSTLLLSLGLVAAWLLRRCGPALRAFLLQMTLVGVVIGSILSVGLAGRVQPVWEIRAAPTLPSPLGIGEGDSPIQEPGVKVGRLDAPASPSSRVVHEIDGTEGVPLPRILTTLWAGGATLLLLWLVLCQWHLVNLRGRAAVITDGRAFDTLAQLSLVKNVRAPLLYCSPAIRSPFLVGILRPAIFLPPTWDLDYDKTALHVILAHELAHNERRDCAWTLLLRLTTALLWPQPLLWLLVHQLDQATEEVCDLMAISPDCPPQRYADTLLALADRALPLRLVRTLGAGIIPVRSSLGRRIQNVLARRQSIMTTPSTRLRLGAVLITTAAAISSLTLVSASVPSPDAPTGVPILGTWIISGDEGKENPAIVEFQSDGSFLLYEPFSHQLTTGTYAIAGASLKVHLTMTTSPSNTVHQYGAHSVPSPGTAVVRFDIVGSKMTIKEKDGTEEIATRATTDGIVKLLRASHPAPTDPMGNAAFVAGLTPVQGPGITATIPQANPAQGAYADTALNMVVDTLRAGGAEEVAVNNVRFISGDTITSRGQDVYVNTARISAPFTVQAIGDPTALRNALNTIKVKDMRNSISIVEMPIVFLPAATGGVVYKYAAPAN